MHPAWRSDAWITPAASVSKRKGQAELSRAVERALCGLVLPALPKFPDMNMVFPAVDPVASLAAVSNGPHPASPHPVVERWFSLSAIDHLLCFHSVCLSRSPILMVLHSVNA